MPKITTQIARQRYEKVPVMDPETGKQKEIPVSRKTRSGREVTRKVFETDKTKPLPPRKCEKCGKPLEIGKRYRSIGIKRQFGGIIRYRCMECPTWQPHEYSDALWARVAQLQADADTDMSGIEDEEDAKSKASDIAEAIRELAGEKEEAADNVEQYFPGSETAENARANADALNEWADRVEQALDNVEFPDTEDEECQECEGTGEVDCATCQGTGKIAEESESGKEGDDCPDCPESDGKVDCEACGGEGTIEADEAAREEAMEAWRAEAQQALQDAVDESPDTV
jgi:hypothetical protein